MSTARIIRDRQRPQPTCRQSSARLGLMGLSVLRRVDSDGSGDLDVIEFQEALRRMGQDLTPNQVEQVMYELDLDKSGSIGVSEFLDKLKQAENERVADTKKCKALFDEADDDNSGQLDAGEVAMVAEKMGLGAQLEEPDFLKNMVKEMEQIHADSLGMLGEDEEDEDGEVSFDEFVSRLALPCSHNRIVDACKCRSLEFAVTSVDCAHRSRGTLRLGARTSRSRAMSRSTS